MSRQRCKLAETINRCAGNGAACSPQFGERRLVEGRGLHQIVKHEGGSEGLFCIAITHQFKSFAKYLYRPLRQLRKCLTNRLHLLYRIARPIAPQQQFDQSQARRHVGRNSVYHLRQTGCCSLLSFWVRHLGVVQSQLIQCSYMIGMFLENSFKGTDGSRFSLGQLVHLSQQKTDIRVLRLQTQCRQQPLF